MPRSLAVLLAVGVPALVLLVTETVAWEGGYFPWYYVTPLAVLTPWLFILRWRHGSPGHRTIAYDLVVSALAALRIAGPVIPVSGHALFLTYAAVTVPQPLFRVAAILALAQAAYLKTVAWGEPGSVAGGAMVGLGLALLLRRAVPGPNGLDPA